ncbi:MFS transporter [Acidocella sp.]|uniref:MFS transporter n=1 Tax=Acidocella sp. TaxID=50710 RepID=UPI003CFEB641
MSGIGGNQIHVIMASLVLTMFMGSVEQAIVAPALSAMGATFHTMANVSWVVTGYLLSSTPGTLVAGTMSDIWGRRITLLASLIIFTLGSALCAVAPNMAMLIVGRMVQGLGGGGLLSLPNTIVADIISPRERGRYQVYISGTYAFAGLSGPIVGGFLATYWSWRGVFWAFVPLAILAVVSTERTLRGLPPPKERRRFDGIGTMLLSGTLILLLLAVQSVTRGAEPIFAAFLLVSLILGSAFIRYELRQDDPLLPVSILANRVASVTSGGAFFVMAVNASLAAYLPIFYEARFGFSMSRAGVALALPLLGIVAGSYAGGQYMRRSGQYKLPPVTGAALGAVAYLLLAIGAGISQLAILALTFLAGIGTGACLPPMLVAVQNSVPRHLMGVATSLQICFRSVGGMLGVAVFGIIVLTSSAPEHGFIMFFAGCSAILFIAAVTLMLFLPELPFRATAAAFEENG